MKKLLLFLLLLAPVLINAQNLQLHYDLGRNNYSKGTNYGFFTTTLEMFKPDSLGSTFWFVDMDYRTDKGSIRAAYWEIARELNISKNFPLQLHLEYNGGLFLDDAFGGGGINHIWLIGVNYPFMIGNAAFSTYATYNYISGNTQGADFQWTGVWNVPFLKKFMFSGFVDLWSTDNFNSSGTRDGKQMIFLTEPQLWYSLNRSFSIGAEVEISRNFVFGEEDVQVYPTIAVKWNF
ncbi:MAG: DUF5020 family protein [Bacteroidales bacterium]|nr:DUF5020 family protein [Bacteroidales bacterium]